MSLFQWSGWRRPMKKKRRCEVCGEVVWSDKAEYCPTCLAEMPEPKK